MNQENEFYRENCEFFELVRSLANRLSSASDSNGSSTRLRGIRFRADPSMSFPATEVSSLKKITNDDGSNWLVEVNLTRLLGSTGALPPHLSCLAQDVGSENRSAFRDLISIFEDRLISLYFRSAAKSQWLISYELEKKSGHNDPFTRIAKGLAGTSENEETRIPGFLPIFHAGDFSSARRPPLQLEKLLTKILGCEVNLTEQYGMWRRIGSANQTTLGRGSVAEDSGNCLLGVSACVGSKVWTCQGQFLVSLGPLSYAEFDSLLPRDNEASKFSQLCEIIRLHSGAHLDFFVQLVLHPDAVPKFRAGRKYGSKLGKNTWISSREFTQPISDCVLPAEFGA